MLFRSGGNVLAIQLLADNGARLDVVNKKGWMPVTAADGVEYTPAVLKRYPDAAALLRKLMQARGLVVPSSTQPGVGLIAGAPPAAATLAGTDATKGVPAPAAGGKRSAFSGVYTEAQATRGQAVYKQACAHCHSEDLLGERSAPALAGQAFSSRWKDLSVHEMLEVIRRTMPQEAPDSLGTAGYIDLISFLLKANGAPAGKSELPADAAALESVIVPNQK